LVGTNHGEWGGELTWQPDNGKREYSKKITSSELQAMQTVRSFCSA
jgi:hypothetical protein